MVGLMDIAPMVERISIMGAEIEVRGIDIEGFSYLLSKYPELRKLMSGVAITPESVMQIAGPAVASIIAAGCGECGNAQAEKVAASIPIVTQLELLAVVIRLTLPGGVDPFVEQVQNLFGALEGYGKGQGTKSP